MIPFFTVTEQTTPEDLKRRYRNLCKRYHPDRGGSDEKQAQINAEYQKALEKLSEMATQNGDTESFDQIFKIMERHARSTIRAMYAELKTPMIRRYVPRKYQTIVNEMANLIRYYINYKYLK